MWAHKVRNLLHSGITCGVCDVTVYDALEQFNNTVWKELACLLAGRGRNDEGTVDSEHG